MVCVCAWCILSTNQLQSDHPGSQLAQVDARRECRIPACHGMTRVVTNFVYGERRKESTLFERSETPSVWPSSVNAGKVVSSLFNSQITVYKKVQAA